MRNWGVVLGLCWIHITFIWSDVAINNNLEEINRCFMAEKYRGKCSFTNFQIISPLPSSRSKSNVWKKMFHSASFFRRTTPVNAPLCCKFPRDELLCLWMHADESHALSLHCLTEILSWCGTWIWGLQLPSFSLFAYYNIFSTYQDVFSFSWAGHFATAVAPETRCSLYRFWHYLFKSGSISNIFYHSVATEVHLPEGRHHNTDLKISLLLEPSKSCWYAG